MRMRMMRMTMVEQLADGPLIMPFCYQLFISDFLAFCFHLSYLFHEITKRVLLGFWLFACYPSVVCISDVITPPN